MESTETNEAGVIFIDPQGDTALRDQLFNACLAAGKDDQLLVVQPADSATKSD